MPKNNIVISFLMKILKTIIYFLMKMKHKGIQISR